MLKDREMIRIELWTSVYIAYVGAANAIKEDGAARWADIALDEFDKRFPKKTGEEEVKL